MDQLISDLRTAWRGLMAARANVALAVLTLALGIGVNTAVFSVLDAVLIRPVPYADAERLGTLWTLHADDGISVRGGFDADLVEAWRRQTDLLDRVEGSESRSFVFEDDRGATMVTGALVTPGLMSMLGAVPLEGRLFAEGDGRAGRDRLVIVSERFWREHLGAADPAAGREIILNDERHTIAGVMPASFRYPDEAQEFWLPFDPAQPPTEAAGGALSMLPLVRVHSDLNFDTAIAPIQTRGSVVHESVGHADRSARLTALGIVSRERTERSLVLLGAAVFFLLLIVCANVANLTLSRALAQTRDTSIRSALGASRGRLVRAALVEYGLVGLAGAACGVLVARLIVFATVGLLPEAMTISSLNAIDLDGRALAFLALTSCATVLLFGLPPALLSSRVSVTDGLRSSSRSTTGLAGARRLRSGLAVAEVSLSIVLLVGAALLTRSLVQLQSVDTGIDTHNLLSTRIGLPSPLYDSDAVRDQFARDLLAAIRRAPDVERAALGSLPTERSMVAFGEVELGHQPGNRSTDQMFAVVDVWPGYFAATGIPIVDGREFRDDDVEGATIVSEDLASRLWPDTPALGARFRVDDHPWRTVVGVAAEVREPSEDPMPTNGQLYYPHDQVSGVYRGAASASSIAAYQTLIIRATRPDAAAGAIADLVHSVDPAVVVGRTEPVARRFADAISRPRVVSFMMTTFAAFGLLLAAAGLYGVLSHLVVVRMKEIGIRLALGATPRDVGRSVVGSGLELAVVGIVLGLAASLALTRQMQTLLYEVDPFDPTAFISVCAILLATATLATWLPARRAMRADPITLLRDE